MEQVRYGIVGLGNQGKFYTDILTKHEVPDAVLTAACDIDADRRRFYAEQYPDIPCFANVAEMFASGLCDVVCIETPHYSHPELAMQALDAGLHVIVDKPAGVYTKQVEEMLAYHNEKHSDKLLGIMFNQRTNPAFKMMKQMIADGKLGEIKRTCWIITDWYRADQYYKTGAWRGTWCGEGGGVLYNQAPHNLDLFQWIVGMMPTKVRAFCHFGKWHPIAVEDDVTAYVEYENGATGTFITTTADAPGTNRFEIVGDRGTLLYENGKLTFTELALSEREHCRTTPYGFNKPEKTVTEPELPKENPQHAGIFRNVTNTLLGKEALYAPADEALCGVQLANAMHLSTWLDRTVSLPFDGELFLAELNKQRAAENEGRLS